MTRLHIALSLAAAGVVALAAEGAASVTAQSPRRALSDTTQISDALVKQGREIFHGRGTCFACHGPDLKGSPVAPPLRPHAWLAAKNGDLDEIYRVITHGVPGTLMVSHPGGISDADARALAEYIWSVDHGGAKP